MSETTTPNASQSQNDTNQVANGDNGGSTYTPPETQEDLNRIIQNRIQRVEAKYADYDQLKADSAKLGAAVAERDDYKSRLVTANAELSTYKAKEQRRQWAVEVAEETGVPAEALRGETKEEMAAHASTLKKYMGSAPIVSGDGHSPKPPAASTGALFAETIKSMI